MSIGIYKLVFDGTTKIYIGQSINIEARFKDHLNILEGRRGIHKLQDAYNLYGKPSLQIIEECKVNELNNKEIYYIEFYNSLIDGYNSIPGGNSYCGENNSNSRYSNEDYFMVLWYLIQVPTYTHEEISSILDVSLWIVRQISRGESHEWLKELYPIEYNSMLTIHTTGRRSNLNLGRNIPVVISPDGIEHEVPNVFQFAKRFGLNQPGLHKLISGARQQYRGWRIKGMKPHKPYPAIQSPEGNTYTIEYGKAKEFANEHGLEYTCLHDVLTYKGKTHKGWRLSQV